MVAHNYKEDSDEDSDYTPVTHAVKNVNVGLRNPSKERIDAQRQISKIGNIKDYQSLIMKVLSNPPQCQRNLRLTLLTTPKEALRVKCQHQPLHFYHCQHQCGLHQLVLPVQIFTKENQSLMVSTTDRHLNLRWQ